MISCDKAALICNKTQYREATHWEVVKLSFHLLMCKTCSKATEKNIKLTSLCDRAKLKSLSHEDKLAMKERLNKQF